MWKYKFRPYPNSLVDFPTGGRREGVCQERGVREGRGAAPRPVNHLPTRRRRDGAWVSHRSISTPSTRHRVYGAAAWVSHRSIQSDSEAVDARVARATRASPSPSPPQAAKQAKAAAAAKKAQAAKIAEEKKVAAAAKKVRADVLEPSRGGHCLPSAAIAEISSRKRQRDLRTQRATRRRRGARDGQTRRPKLRSARKPPRPRPRLASPSPRPRPSPTRRPHPTVHKSNAERLTARS